jgi:hypothetical protein
MHVRVHARIPYTVQVYVNGREWLARQLDTAGVGYLRHDQRASASTPDRLARTQRNLATAPTAASSRC